MPNLGHQGTPLTPAELREQKRLAKQNAKQSLNATVRQAELPDDVKTAYRLLELLKTEDPDFSPLSSILNLTSVHYSDLLPLQQSVADKVAHRMQSNSHYANSAGHASDVQKFEALDCVIEFRRSDEARQIEEQYDINAKINKLNEEKKGKDELVRVLKIAGKTLTLAAITVLLYNYTLRNTFDKKHSNEKLVEQSGLPANEYSEKLKSPRQISNSDEIHKNFKNRVDDYAGTVTMATITNCVAKWDASPYQTNRASTLHNLDIANKELPYCEKFNSEITEQDQKKKVKWTIPEHTVISFRKAADEERLLTAYNKTVDANGSKDTINFYYMDAVSVSPNVREIENGKAVVAEPAKIKIREGLSTDTLESATQVQRAIFASSNFKEDDITLRVRVNRDKAGTVKEIVFQNEDGSPYKPAPVANIKANAPAK